jgi:FkbM family methyltransferase
MASINERLKKALDKRGPIGVLTAGLTHVNPLSERNRASRVRKKSIEKLKAEAGRDGCIVRNILGSKMRLDVSSGLKRKLELDLAIDGIREADSTAYYEQLLDHLKSAWTGRDIVVLDVGANIGYYALLQAKVFGSAAKVIAIEPDADNASRLSYNCQLNDYRQIEVLVAAAGESAGTGQLSMQGSSNLHKMSQVAVAAVAQQTVEIIHLDAIVRREDPDCRKPFIVRMDIEGYEGYAFRGLKDFMSSARDAVIFLELHDDAGSAIGDIIDQMIASNFLVFRGGGKIDPISSGREFYRWFVANKVVEHVFAYRHV